MFRLDVVRTFRSAVCGRPEGLHYIGVKNASSPPSPGALRRDTSAFALCASAGYRDVSLVIIRPVCSILDKGVVREAVEPALAWFRRRDDRMRRRARVLRCVAVRRRVAAQRDPARLTSPSGPPARADLRALLTGMGFRLHDGLHEIDVRACTGHWLLL